MLTYELVFQLIVLSVFIPPMAILIRRKAEKIRILAAILLMLYTAFSVGIFFFPILYDTGAFQQGTPPVNLIPFDSIVSDFKETSTEAAAKQIISNTIAFLPIGFLIPILFSRFHSLWKLAAFSTLLSVSIELIQWCISATTHIPNHPADIDHVILNLAGTLLGYCVYRALKFLRRKRFTGALTHLQTHQILNEPLSR